MSLTHKKISAVPDNSNAALIQPSDWNDTHIMSEEGVLISDATGIHAVALTPDLVFPGAGNGLPLQFLRRNKNASTPAVYEFKSEYFLIASDYHFELISGSSSISGSLTNTGTNSLTLTPVPLGVNGNDANHYLRISGGTGNAETVLITGGTAVSGAASGTIIFTTVNAHSGAWSIKSGSGGIFEAANVLIRNGKSGTIVVDQPATIYQRIHFPGRFW